MAEPSDPTPYFQRCLAGSLIVLAGSIALAVMAPGIGSIALAVASAVLAILVFQAHKAASAHTRHSEVIGGEHRDMLESISAMPVAFSVFNAQDRLVAWNPAYEALYPGAFEKLAEQGIDHQNIGYADLLKAAAPEDSEPQALQAHIAERVARHRDADGSTQERKYPDTGWHNVTRFKTESGAVATMAPEVNEQRQAKQTAMLEREKRKGLEVKLHTLSNIDTLTGAVSRRAFLSRVDQEIERSCRYDNPMSMLVVDIDNFKLINNEYGHDVGDQVIALVSSATREILRADVDVIGRVGAKEFGVLLPQIDTDGGIACAQRVREAISRTKMKVDADKHLDLTVSIGVSSLEDRDVNVDVLLDEAIGAVSQAKESGRDQVALFGTESESLLDQPETLRETLGNPAPLPDLPVMAGGSND